MNHLGIKRLASKLIYVLPILIPMKNSELIVILGASDNPMRPSHIAAKLLDKRGFRTHCIHYGTESNEELRAAVLDQNEKTITIYLNPHQQKKYYQYLMALKPGKIIFNPGTENEELRILATQNNIKVVSGCTIALMMNSLL
jgi:uncharacterized protein